MRARAFVIRIAVGIVAAWLLGSLFFELAEEISGTFLGTVERRLLEFIAADREPDETLAMIILSLLGSASALLIIGVTVIAILWKRGRRLAAGMMLLVIGGAGLLSVGLKYSYDRPRPDISPVVSAPLASFPSGHSLAAVAIYGFLAYLISRHVHWHWWPLVWAVYLALVVGIGISRVYLGIHWPTDVIGGMLAGATWLLASISAYEVLLHLGERRMRRSRGEE